MMDERSVPGAQTERPIPPTAQGSPAAPADPPHLADPRAVTILTTEHYSLLTARSLVYNEAFSRAAMFLTFLTGTLVALGFVSQGTGFTPEFLIVAIVLLSFDLFVGLATLGRISSASVEEFRALQGMNRLRHAYLEMVPTLTPYMSTGSHDDMASVLEIYGAAPAQHRLVADFAHGLTTTPGMIATITAAVGGALAGTLALVIGASTTLSIIVGLVTLVVLNIVLWYAALRAFTGMEARFQVRFPPDSDRTS
jgi:hypothetical protein